MPPPHAGDWLLALLISACGLRVNDEAVCIAAGLRLGIDLCAPHECPYGAMVRGDGPHGMSRSLGPGRTARDALLSDIILWLWRDLSKACFPGTKEPTGLPTLMGDVQLGRHSFHGRVGNALPGMPLISTSWHPLCHSWQNLTAPDQLRLRLLLLRSQQSKIRPTTLPFCHHTALCP